MKRCGFVGLPPQTPLSENVLDRQEALKLFDELEQIGHVHLAFYGFTMSAETPQFVGTCNCCGCCCGVLRGITHLGLAEAPQRSNYRAVIDSETCIACGVCQERCPVDAIADDENSKSKVERAKCIGCGVCVIGCPVRAIELAPVSEEEWFHVPNSMAEWEEMRLQFLASENWRMAK
jgi:Pyruvate/2-oxoacid:ferredoxin oxidoreductase delta subunit